jgi:flagellar assembly protein FliH
MAWRTVGGNGRSTETPAGEGEASGRRLEDRLREAHAAGLREGEAAGRTSAAAELKPVIDRLAHSIEEMAGFRVRLRREAETDVVRLALAIARRILMRELAIDPEALHGLVLGALEKLQTNEISRVRVHPAHAALLTNALQHLGQTRGIEIVTEPGLAPGTVIFETERGSLDASVQSQLVEIERGLTDRLRSSR